MPVCAVCSSPASAHCSRCKCVSYCTPAHQKVDWPAHKTQCPRLAQEALSAVFHPCDEELLLRITTCLAQNGYHKEVGVMVQLNKAFWTDEQIWDAYKDVPGKGGRTRLMYASFRGLQGRVQWFLARGARAGALMRNTGLSALTVACEMGHTAVVRALCDRGGADVNATTPSDGSTVLMLASHPDMVRELCARGARVNAAKTSNGYTPLMLASEEGNLGVVKELLKLGANVKATTPANGSHALIMASQNGHVDVVRELCERGCSVNAGMTSDGWTALMWGSVKCNLRLVKELCARGANVNAAKFTDGSTVLMEACKNTRPSTLEVVRELLKGGADVNAGNVEGDTALMTASQAGILPVVRELVARGANVNAVMAVQNGTALMRASFHGHLEVMRELLDRGANVNAATTDNGMTVLMNATLNGQLELVRLLLQRGASKGATTAHGHTAFDIASSPQCYGNPKRAALVALLKP